MSNLTRASRELFGRAPDERFASLDQLQRHCQEQKDRSFDHWEWPKTLHPRPEEGRLRLALETGGVFDLNDWSFSQLCRFAGVSRDTVNRVTPETACRIFAETMPESSKPLQVFTQAKLVRSLHGTSYTRLYNADLLAALQTYATGFQPPQPGMNGGTGLYCGEQDLFCFLIDPAGWAEINGEAFAPGFFLWNSEVGRRSVGIQTFWFQAVCANHIVWDVTEVEAFTRKHTANVHECFNEISRRIARLVEQRDQRRDGFVQVIRKAMATRLGATDEDALKALSRHGISHGLAEQAVAIAAQRGRFTVFALVDALTRLTTAYKNAGDRVEADARAATLLALAA